MSKSNRVTKVQTPGAPNPPADNPLSDPPDGAQEATPTTPAKAEAKVQDRPNRQQYAEMHADEIDPTTLAQAVLSKDGWVCPVAPAK